MPKDFPQYSVSVRELVEWCFRKGDLRGERRFTGPQRALAGQRGHKDIQGSRPDGYIPEFPLSHTFVEHDDGFSWTIRGRADGFWDKPDQLLIEEIKTVTPNWDGQPRDLHWAQAKIYAAILCSQKNLPSIETQLTYLELESGMISTFRESWEAHQLLDFLNEARSTFREALKAKHDWNRLFTSHDNNLAFPHSPLREGQENIVKAVRQAIENGENCFLQAPTGLGKTIATIFPALEDASNDPNTIIFFLTARNTNKANAEHALESIRQHGGMVKSVTLGAAKDWCLDPEGACLETDCPYANGYFDRCRNALIEISKSEDNWNKSTLRHQGKDQLLCPSALSHQLAEWANVIIADYNHALDPKSRLKEFFGEESNRRIVLLIDEAHNLPDRARTMFSASISKMAVRDTLDALPKSQKLLQQCLKKILSNWPDPSIPRDIQEIVIESIPQSLISSLEKFKPAAEQFLMLNEPSTFRQSLTDTYFLINDFLQRLQTRTSADYLLQSANTIRIFCLNPNENLKAIFKNIHSVIFFSATLTPPEYFKKWLSSRPQEQEQYHSLPSPFPQDNLKIFIETSIPTQFRFRKNSAEHLTRLILKFILKIQGSQLVFFPSYDYLDLIHQHISPQLPNPQSLKIQERQSSLETQNQFIDFLAHNPENQTRIGFAVLGGIYAEGIDIPDNSLNAVTVVGVGLPQICTERNLIIDHFNESLGNSTAFDYAYTFPGMTKVIQAVGRLIRSHSDSGSALLIDPRYATSTYQNLMPPHWTPHYFTFPTP